MQILSLHFLVILSFQYFRKDNRTVGAKNEISIKIAIYSCRIQSLPCGNERGMFY